MYRLDSHRKIAAWASAEVTARFCALAASRGLSESKLLGLVIDVVLARNPIDGGAEQQRGRAGKGDHISVRLRSGDGTRLRERARARGLNYTTYAAVLIRSHLFSNPSTPLTELRRLEGGLVENFVRRMPEVATGNERIAKALLANVAAQRSRALSVEREHSMEDRAR
jgi:hypothetical protein